MLDISVIFATRDRAAILEETLVAIQSQDTGDLTWELIVADNGSSDETRDVLMRRQRPLPIHVVYEPEAGKTRALNAAMLHARGKLLVFTDDDVRPERKWLSELHRASRSWPQADIFCGPIVPQYPPGFPEWLRRHRLAAGAFAKFDAEGGEGFLDPSRSPFGPNFAVRREAMVGMRFCERIGPCETNYPMCDETELLDRLKMKGFRIVYIPTASVAHVVRSSQADESWLLRRAFNYGRGLPHVRPRPGRFRILGAPGSIYLDYAVRLIARWRGQRDVKARLLSRAGLEILCGELREFRELAKQPCNRPTCGECPLRAGLGGDNCLNGTTDS